MKSSCLFLLLLLGLSYGRFITEILQSGEMGVELVDGVNFPSNVYFFAVAQGLVESSDSAYILSFGTPTLEGGCSQSLTSICTENTTITDGWEWIEYAHYPTALSRSALYIRRAINLRDDEECISDSLVRTVVNDTLISLSGTLMLSVVMDCKLGNSGFDVLREYPFSLTYNLETNEIQGLTYDIISYAYTTKPMRIIESPNYGTIFEVEVVTERVVDYQSTLDTPNSTAFPSRLSGAVVRSQELNVDMKLAAVSLCRELTGVVCTQSIFFTISDLAYRRARPPVTGTLILRSQLLNSEGKLESIVDLQATFDVDTKVETGEQKRSYDVFMTIDGMYYDPIKLYIKDAENSTQITTQTVNCINVIRLDQQRLDIHSIFLYTDHPENEEETLLTVLYVPGRVCLGSFERLSESSARFCFTFSTLIRMPNSTLIPYFIQVDYGQKSDVDFFTIGTETSPTTTSEDLSTAIMTMQKRSLYNPGDSFSISRPSTEEMSDPQLLYFNCPYWNQCYYRGYCVRCSGWDADDVSTGAWVFIVILMSVVAIGLVALCFCYPAAD